MAVRTKLFRYNGFQAVRLPQDVSFPADVQDLVILREGSRRVIVPADKVWDDLFESPGIDFPDRDQPPPRVREPF